ncbi:lipopolysaccharide biosynthesis protein [Luteipulveratus mongoliensis]|uniref:Uncharacterized protein n=1 Tax=Luteipulveratus mongoliensis TaxID=571913 RepID=A0A0K1JGT6_9MICO|nr:lipopolysaccharide biosynthesis protein [Luteipulveratus mongoliensis]AKU15932.1 hypothetical protein VV02_08815 [Luteipulveratus mongoliensis]
MSDETTGAPEVDEGRHVTSAVVARGAKHTAASQIVTQTVRFGTNIVLARLLTPNDFGVVAIALVVTALLDQLKDMGTGSALIQRPKVDDTLLNAVFYLNVVLGLALAVGLFAGAEPLAATLGNSAAAPAMRGFAFVTLVTSLGQIHHSLLRRDLRFFEIAVVTCVGAVATAAVAVTSALAGLTFWALVLGAAAGAVVSTGMVWRYDRWRPSLNVDVRSLRSIWGYSFNLFLSNLVFFFFTQADKVIVSSAFGAAPLGAYSMAQRTIASPMQSVSSVVDEVTFPAFSRRQDDNESLRSGFIRSSRVIAFATFPLMGGLAALATPTVHVVFGAKWDQLIPLIWVLGPICAVLSVTSTSSQLLLAKGRSDWSFRWGLVYSVLLVGAELIGVHWGLVGVAAAYAIGNIVLIPFGLIMTFHLIGLRLRDYLLALVSQLLITLGMVACVLAAAFVMRRLGSPEWLELIVGLLVGVGAYAGLVLWRKPPAWRELRVILRERAA